MIYKQKRKSHSETISELRRHYVLNKTGIDLASSSDIKYYLGKHRMTLSQWIVQAGSSGAAFASACID